MPWTRLRVEVLVLSILFIVLFFLAITQLTHAFGNASEHLALISLRQMSRACQFFSLVHQRYPSHLTELGPPYSTTRYLGDDLIGNGRTTIKQGYVFTYTPHPSGQSLILQADPQTDGSHLKHFYVDEQMAIRTSSDGPADAQDTVVP